MTRVVVTGGAGRLGRSVVARLDAAGLDVVSVDRVVADHLDPVVAQLELDLMDGDATARTVTALAPDAIVHLAGIAVPFSPSESTILHTNVMLAQHVLAAALAAGVGHVLLASSPTVIGYGAPGGWTPDYLPLDESHPRAPWHAYALAKTVIEDLAATIARGHPEQLVVGSFRPCYVISPEEWEGAPTQQGHTVRDRLEDPVLAAVSLFNYVDARDAGDFVVAWLERAAGVPPASTFFVGAADALATRPLAELVPQHLPGLAGHAAHLTGSTPLFAIDRARELLGWSPRHSWRTALPDLAGGDGSTGHLGNQTDLDPSTQREST